MRVMRVKDPMKLVVGLAAGVMLITATAVGCGASATPAPATIVPAATAGPAATNVLAAKAVETATEAGQPNEQGVTREGIGRGAGNVKEVVKIEAGKTDLRVGRTALAPGGYISWHSHDGSGLIVVERGTVTVKQADGTTADYPTGSAFFDKKGDVHRFSNSGNVDAVLLLAFAIAGGPPAETPSMAFTSDPTTTTPLAGQPNEQGVTRQGIGRGTGNVKEMVKIEVGKTDLRFGRTTLAPGGYLSWHSHSGPVLYVVEKGTVSGTQADGATADYPAGSTFFEPKGDVHRASNNGNIDAVSLVIAAIPGGTPAENPSMTYTKD